MTKWTTPCGLGCYVTTWHCELPMNIGTNSTEGILIVAEIEASCALSRTTTARTAAKQGVYDHTNGVLENYE